MAFSLIVAMDRQRGIGKDNDLMWHLPADMKFFKETTSDCVVVMGRKNYESIPEKFRPLPNRENVVLTRNVNYTAPGASVFSDFRTMITYLSKSEKKVFIIGGAEIYKLALEAEAVDEMYISHVNHSFGADTFFPDFNLKRWNIETVMEFPADEKNKFSFSTLKYTKK
jgi:dihydrofolate reductase